MFCSLCGDSLSVSEALICRNCGLLYCQFCRKSLDAASQNNPLVDITNSVSTPPPSTCKCDNGDIQSLEELRGYLIQDFLNYKHKIQVIANEPVEYFQMLLELREKLISIGKRFILLPDQFAFQKDPMSTFSMAEQFALEHLQDISHNIRALYNKLLVNKEMLIEPDELTQVNLKLSILYGKIEKFESGLQSYFYTLLEDKKSHEEALVSYSEFLNLLQVQYDNLQSMLDDEERIFFISDPLSSNLSSTMTRNVQVMVTEKRMVVFRQPLLKIKKKVKVLKTITAYQVTGLIQKPRKFRSSSIIIRTNDDEIELSSSKEQITLLEKFLKLFVENMRIPAPKEWKTWQIGRIWSSDGYYASIDNLLRWELRTGSRSPNKNYYPSSSAIGMPPEFSANDDNMEQSTQIIEYIDKQLEKATQRIRVLEYIINDLKSRKNTMSVNEFFSLYEQFSMKLKDLEAERNSLLSHYSKGAPRTASYC